MTKVSVIIPVYNVEAYLEECIQSVLNQTYRDFEIILVNDGSTDGSGIICDRFFRENPGRISVIHSSNQGALLARIAGIQTAQGDIVVFLDSDDSFRDDALERIAECFLENDCDLLLFDTGVSLNYPSQPIGCVLPENVIFEGNAKKTLYQKLISYQIPNSVCLKAIKKECISPEADSSRFTGIKHGEDLLMSAWFLTDCNRILYLKEGLYYYRARSGSAVHTFDIQRKESIKVVHTELEECIDKWEMPELCALHNARKVKGWIDTLRILLKNRQRLTPAVFREQLHSMAEDPYFTAAYACMDSTQLSSTYRLIAFCLIKEQYLLLRLLTDASKVIRKMKSGR